MSFVDQVRNSKGELVYLVRGKDQGRPAWHYVHVRDKQTLPLFLKQVDTGTVDVSQFGEVLYSGWGQDPPEDIVKKIEEKYG